MFENMIKATKGRSVIFISHRLSSAALADRVILMDEGRIAEMGSHGELDGQRQENMPICSGVRRRIILEAR